MCRVYVKVYNINLDHDTYIIVGMIFVLCDY
jgi:hypothetical protein